MLKRTTNFLKKKKTMTDELNTDMQDCEEGEGEGKIPNSLSADKNSQILCFSYLVPTVKFCYNTGRDVNVNPVTYLNQPFFKLYSVICIRGRVQLLYLFCYTKAKT